MLLGHLCIRNSMVFLYYFSFKKNTKGIDYKQMFLYNYSGDCMYTYLDGKITEIESSYITLDVNGIGYMVYVANPYQYNIGDISRVYIYQYVREDEISLYGFKDKREKDLFLKLINVKGLGCKMALPILATGSIDGIIDAVERENILYLKKFPKIGDKVAKQMILDLKGKLSNTIDLTMNIDNTELVETLKALGYKNVDISRVLPQVNKGNSLESQVKEALRLLLK